MTDRGHTSFQLPEKEAYEPVASEQNIMSRLPLNMWAGLCSGL